MHMRLNKFSEKVSKKIKNNDDKLMNKKVVVISTSIRANSNSKVLAKSFADGASYARNKVEFITLKDKQISSTISVIIKISPSFQKRMMEIFRPAYSCSNQSAIS